MTFHLRPIQDTPEDIEVLLKLVKELAEYEKSPESAKATPELIRQNIFQHGYANAVLAMEGDGPQSAGRAVGFALYFFNFSTWTGRPGLYLEDLYVCQSHRARGVGKALFARLGKIARERDCARLDWVVLKWNTPAIKFYESINAQSMTEWQGMRLEGQPLADLESLDQRDGSRQETKVT